MCDYVAALDRSAYQLKKDRDELHRLTINILSAFDIIILPWIDVQAMVQRKGAKAMSKTNKRKGLLLAHGAFRQKLIHHRGDASIKSRRLTWVTEQFTSKICGQCFRYCGYLGGSRIFKCPNKDCGIHIDRDGNAARNIWIWGWLEALRWIKKEDKTGNVASVDHDANTKARSEFMFFVTHAIL